MGTIRGDVSDGIRAEETMGWITLSVGPVDARGGEGWRGSDVSRGGRQGDEE